MLCMLGEKNTGAEIDMRRHVAAGTRDNTIRPLARHALAVAMALACAAPLPLMAAVPTANKSVDAKNTAVEPIAGAADDTLVEAADAASAENYFQAGGAGDGSDAAFTDGVHAIAAGASSFAGAENAAAFGYGATALGMDSTAVGALTLSLGQGASAFGFGTTATGDYSSAIGYGSNAGGFASIAMGYNASSNGAGAIAIGTEAYLTVAPFEGIAHFVTRADGVLSTALGPGAASDGAVSVAIGPGAESYGALSVAIGHRAQAAEKSVAMGNFAEAHGYLSSAFGSEAEATGNESTAVGGAATARGETATALGVGTFANGDQSTAVGASAMSWGYRSVALGNAALSQSEGTVAIGFQTFTWGEGSVALGYLAQTGGDRPLKELPPPCDPNTQDCGGVIIGPFDYEGPEQPPHAVALGEKAHAFGNGSLALGYQSLTMGESSVALGANSMTDRDNTVSVGASQDWMRRDGFTVAAFTRQIVNVSAGTEATDAVNVAQLGQYAGALGGGASMQSGVLSAPTYAIQGASYNDVGAALAAVDSRLSGLQDTVDNLPPPPPTQPEPPQPPATGDGIAYDGDAKTSLTLAGANGTQIRNLANGVATTDAATKGQVDAADAATLASANNYTDVTATRTLSSANGYTDQRFQTLSDQFSDFTQDIERRFSDQDKHLDKMGAMNSAMMSMAINAANTHSPRGRVAVGAGWQNGESALSVGYAKPIGDRASFSIGGAFTDDDSSAGIGFGLDL